MGSQRFCLKWNNHQSNLAAEFEDLYDSGAFVDVTLACDGLALKAHKIVLSACSPFFRSLLRDNPCDHPIIIMKDMKYTQLKDILQFMYKGEVSIARDQLPSLVKAAETLKIKGLAEVPHTQPEQSFNQHFYDESYENNNQPPSSSINFNHKRKTMRKRFRDGLLQQSLESYQPVKSKLESTLLGELDGKSGSQMLNENFVGKPDPKSSLSTSDISANLDNSNDPVIDNSNASSEFSSSPNGKIPIVEHSFHHVSAEAVDPSLSTQDTPSLSPKSSFSSTSHSEQKKDNISEDLEDVDIKPKFPSLMKSPNEDFTPRSVTENDTMYDDFMQSNLDNNNLGDTCYSSMSAHDVTDPLCRAPNGGSAISKMFAKNSEFSGDEIVKYSRTCRYCGKNYHPSSLSRHIKAMHMGITYTCQHCNLSFNDKSNMRKHKKYYH